MAKLTDTQLILLAHAAQNANGSIYPLPASQLENGAPSERTTKSVRQLLSRGLIEEREASDRAVTCRTDGDIGYGIFVTAVGLTVIGVQEGEQSEAPLVTAAASAPARITKADSVLALVARDTGATMAELIEATGWLPHTTRAVLTGLRKKGHSIERSRRGADTCYRIAA